MKKRINVFYSGVVTEEVEVDTEEELDDIINNICNEIEAEYLVNIDRVEDEDIDEQ